MTSVSRGIKALYTDAYGDPEATRWRDVGAVEKADNVTRLWVKSGLTPHRPTVVEIGCGEGALSAALAGRSFFSTYRGFDISTSGVTAARGREVPDATFTVVEGDRIPVQDRSADLVVLSHVVEHLEHPRVLLNEALRIAPHVFVEVPLELHWRAPRDYRLDALGHINKYNATAIRHLVQSCGFNVLAAETTCVSRASAQFFDRSSRTRVNWEIKSRLLKIAPPLARQLFTYHEALLLRSPELRKS